MATMASKYWFVVKSQPKPIAKGLSPLPMDQVLIKYLNLRNYQSSISPVSFELMVIEPYLDFHVRHSKKSGLCSNDSVYDIFTGKERLLFQGIQHNSMLWCFNNPYEKVILYDTNDHPVLEIEKIDLTGYITKKMTFSVTSSHHGRSKLGIVTKVTNFLEHPKYEIKDSHGQLLFSLILSHSNRGINSYIYNSDRPSRSIFQVLGKDGNAAHIEETKEGGVGSVYKIRLHQMCSVMEKALLLSLLILLAIESNNEGN